MSLAVAALLAVPPGAARAQPADGARAPDAVDAIRARGHLLCGVAPAAPGFALQDRGGWQGMDIDFCRAIASAILGDPGLVRFVPLSAAERFTRLREGEVDILARNTT